MRAQRQLINAKENFIYHFNRIQIESPFVCALKRALNHMELIEIREINSRCRWWRVYD